MHKKFHTSGNFRQDKLTDAPKIITEIFYKYCKYTESYNLYYSRYYSSGKVLKFYVYKSIMSKIFW